MATRYTGLAVVGALNSLLSRVYYLRVIVMMGGVEAKSFARAPSLYVAIALAVAATIWLGIAPSQLLGLGEVSFRSLE